MSEVCDESIVTATSSMGVLEHVREKNLPIQIDVSLAVEKEMTSALTGKVGNPQKIVQRISDKISIVTQEGSSDVETLLHYQCDDCKKTFMLSNKFKAHCLEEHGITNPYKCKECGNAYMNESSLRIHLRTHKNYKPYVCDECGRTFAQCSTWMAHMVRHSGATPHICEVCGKAFATKGDLATHSRIHSATKPFSCKACGLSFPRKSNYTRHMRTHTGEKPYSCEFCSKSFARSENCKEHERLHTREKPYMCELCGMTFSDSGNFSKHRKNHAKKLNKTKNNVLDASLTTTDTIKNHQLEAFEIHLPTEKATTKTRRKQKKKSTIETEESTISFSSVPNLEQPSQPVSKVAVEDPPAQSQPLSISLVRQPVVLTKQMPVSFDRIVVPMNEADRNFQLNGFIKLSSDNVSMSESVTSTIDSRTDTTRQQINPDSLMNDSESLKLSNYRLPVFVSAQNVTNPILTDLTFSPNTVDNQALMMLDYTPDSGYSFNNDNLMLQENLFSRSPMVNLTGTDRFIYNGGLVPHELSVGNGNSAACGLSTDFDITNGVSSFFSSSSTTFDDDLEGQPLDTNKFLNEQYLVKPNKASLDANTVKCSESTIDES